MPTDQLHHTGILVDDLERSAKFYIDALDAHYLFTRCVNEGSSAKFVMGGDDDVAFAYCYLGFRTGAVELMQFLRGAPDWAKELRRGLLPHFALVVDDVHETLQRVLDCGGSAVWPEPLDWGDTKVIYVKDPDGNAIELFNVSLQSIVDTTIAANPHAAP